MISITQKQIDRFWGYVDKEKSDIFYNESRCWEWTSHKTYKGYGRTTLWYKSYFSHRISWILENGDIPNDLFVLHHCDNPSCVNPAHLFLGTKKDNAQDRISKGRTNAPRGDEHWTRRTPEKMPFGEKHGTHTHPESVRSGESHWTHIHPERIKRRKNGKFLLKK